MMIGTVLDSLELARGLPGTAQHRWVRVRCGAELLTALDTVGAQPGERVLLTTGEGAGRLCPELPVDAAILGITANIG